MKKRLALITTIVLLLLAVPNYGQLTTNHSRYADDSKLVLYFAGTLDTLGQTYDSLKSSLFALEDYDAPGTYFSFNYVFTSTTGSPKYLVDLYGTDNGGTNNYLIAQLVDTATAETYAAVASLIGNLRFNQYFLVFEQVALGRDASTFKAWLHAPQKDPALRKF